LFIIGSAAVGFIAWREGCGRTVEVAISLYVFAPFLRRLVDVSAGFEPSGIMLLGPVLAISIPAVDLRHIVGQWTRDDEALFPLILVGICITYGMLLSAFQGDFGPLATIALKMYAPLLFGAWIMRSARQDPSVLDAATKTFMVVSPILGAYAIWQYVSPQDWDRYWMVNVSGAISVLGRPEPFQVRVFSMMNSPASFGTYAACGLLLFGFCSSGWQALLLSLLVAPGLVFTYYRTAWISLALGIAYCALFARTRRRAGLVTVVIFIAIVLLAGSSDFGDVVIERLQTLTGSIADDGSGRARLAQLFEIYRLMDGMLFGLGFSRLSTPLNGVEAVDGEIVTAIIAMGVFVGSVYMLAIVWACMQALSRVRTSSDPRLIVTGAAIVGMLAAVPLTSVTSGEIGLLLWTFIALTTVRPLDPEGDNRARTGQGGSSPVEAGVLPPGRPTGTAHRNMRPALTAAIGPAIVFLATSLSGPAAAAAAEPETCLAEINRVEREFRLPPQLLRAIALVETGRIDPATRQATPWAWSIDVGGAGKTFSSKAAAVEAAAEKLAQGIKSVDVGCMQINLSFHPSAFSSLEEAFAPEANVRYAATFLLALHRQFGDWNEAAKAYHSQSPGLGDEYLRRVAAFWPQAASRTQAGDGFQLSRLALPKEGTPVLAQWLTQNTADLARLRGLYGANPSASDLRPRAAASAAERRGMRLISYNERMP
jgi:hypothetical protein